MVTDPDGNAWVDSSGNEVGDLCLTSFGPSLSAARDPGVTPWNETINGDHYFLQEEWSNADSACEPRARPDSLSFAMTHAPGRERLLAFTAHGADPRDVSCPLPGPSGTAGPHPAATCHTCSRARARTG